MQIAGTPFKRYADASNPRQSLVEVCKQALCLRIQDAIVIWRI